MRNWVICLALFGCGSGADPTATNTEASRAPVAPTGDLLERGHPSLKTLAPGDNHRYHVKLEASQVLAGVVDQRGIDVVVTTYDPSGKKLGELDSPNGNRGPEPFVIEATRAGSYGIEVKAFAVPVRDGRPAATAAPAQPGQYEVRIDAVISADEYAVQRAKERIDSPRILELWTALRAKRPGAVDAFWSSLRGKGPVVERFTGDNESALVTFVFRTDAPYAGMFGGPTAREKPMTRLGSSNLWYLSARMPRDSRADYAFLGADGPPDFHVPWKQGDFGIERWGKKSLDPNNPSTNVDQSRIELPGAAPQPWIVARPETPSGKLTELTLDSAQLHEKRRIGIYTPPGFTPTATYPLVVAFDGEVYGLDRDAALIPLPVIVDNLIATKKIPPVVVALVANQGTRDRDLTSNAAFADFVALELVPKLRADYHAGLTPAATLVTGSSFGGLCAVYVGLQHSAVIGNVLSQSGAFWFRPGDLDSELADSIDTGRLFGRIIASPKLPLRFYLDVGLFETDHRNDILSMNRRMRDVLQAKGYPIRYAEFSGGHDYLQWRGTIADGLIELLR